MTPVTAGARRDPPAAGRPRHGDGLDARPGPRRLTGPRRLRRAQRRRRDRPGGGPRRGRPGALQGLRSLVRGAQDALVRDIGNLYTASLPAWLAAGFEDALRHDRDLDGAEVLLVGYGSGDAAEALPARVMPGWREAAARIGFAEALGSAVELDREQYEALHDGRDVDGLPVF